MSDFTFIELITIDSTNNYAMQLIDANKAHHGLTIVTQTQTGGKGQRGRTWADQPGQSLLMSIIVNPNREIREQFAFNAAVAVAIAKVLQNLSADWQIHIKWPNDIIVNDKKAAGILIENVLRGAVWAHSVVGIGLNLNQEFFPEDLPNATSLKIVSGREFDVNDVKKLICQSVLSYTENCDATDIMHSYNSLLYKKSRKQAFMDQSGEWKATIVAAHPDGTLELQKEDGSIIRVHHGQAEWVWE